MATSAQRAYRAACPNCGAPVEFASAASASAICGFCRSSLLREGDALRRIGVSAELFDDHSPLQLGVQGERQGLAFTLVGRLQIGYEGGSWNEWHALFDNQRSAWLSEDNGAYVISFDAPWPADAPALQGLAAGQRVLADGRAWDVASVQRARLIAAEGELPGAPPLQRKFTVVELRNSAGEVAALDDSDAQQPHWSVGRSVALSELKLSGLKDMAEKSLGARSLQCPGCGAALEVKLATAQSLSCHQCQSVVDVSAGVGDELKHYQQNNAGKDGAEPQIPLGSVSRVDALVLDGEPGPWQVVGYQERCDIPDDHEEETSFWREYLLFNRSQGFAFLVDTNEGWSWVRPLTGVPVVRGEQAQWQDVSYRQRWSYAAKVTWVQGEFYWRVRRDERAQVTDYEGQGPHASKRLSREKTNNEVTWSAGRTLTAAEIADAFGIAPGARAAMLRDAAPLAGKGSGAGKGLMIFAAVVAAMLLLSQCGEKDCDEVKRSFGAASNEYLQCQSQAGSGYRGRSGSSYGSGSGGGGGHK